MLKSASSSAAPSRNSTRVCLKIQSFLHRASPILMKSLGLYSGLEGSNSAPALMVSPGSPLEITMRALSAIWAKT